MLLWYMDMFAISIKWSDARYLSNRETCHHTRMLGGITVCAEADLV